MGLSLYQVDAFTDQPFAGNPAAVCMLVDNVTEGEYTCLTMHVRK